MSWQLVQQQDATETKVEDDVLYERSVRLIVIQKTVTSYENTSAVGSEKSVMTFNWNNSLQIKSLPQGEKYKCLSDDITRTEIPGNGGVRTQTWIRYGAYAEAE